MNANRYRCFILALPVITVTISVSTMIIAYLVATYTRENEDSIPPPDINCTLHTNLPPYISDIGDCKPQSSFFTFGMILSGCVSFSIFAVRFLQVRNFFVNRDCANLASIITGAVLIVGKFMAVSFQLSSHKSLHFFGASGYFLGTFVYALLQTRITYGDNFKLFVFRLVCSFGLFTTGLLFGVFIIPSVESKYLNLNIAQISEWTFGLLKMLFMLSFWFDFKNVLPVFDAKLFQRSSSYENMEAVEVNSFDNISEEEGAILEREQLNPTVNYYNSTPV